MALFTTPTTAGPRTRRGWSTCTGSAAAHLNWNALAPLLEGHVRAVAVDLPGFGHTPAAGRRTSVTANALVLRRFLQKLNGDEQSTLIGNSMGAYVSMIGRRRPALPDQSAGAGRPDPAAGRPARVDPAVRKQFVLNGIPGLGEYLLARRWATVPARQRVAEVLTRCCFDPSRVSAEMVEEMVAMEEELTGSAATPPPIWARRVPSCAGWPAPAPIGGACRRSGNPSCCCTARTTA